MEKVCQESEGNVWVPYENCSGRQLLLSIWPRHPRGRNRSVWAGFSGMCRLCIFIVSQGWYQVRAPGLPTPSSMILSPIFGLEVLCW